MNKIEVLIYESEAEFEKASLDVIGRAEMVMIRDIANNKYVVKKDRYFAHWNVTADFKQFIPTSKNVIL